MTNAKKRLRTEPSALKADDTALQSSINITTNTNSTNTNTKVSEIKINVNRRVRKVDIPDDDLLDSQARSSDDEAASEGHAGASSEPRDAEEALLAEGSALSGDALKDFLQQNFTDFVDEKLFDFDDIDSELFKK